VLNLVALFGFVLVPWASVTLGTAAAAGVGLAVFSAVMTVLAASTLALARRPVGVAVYAGLAVWWALRRPAGPTS
jgi:hypothetical protein